MEQFPFAMGLKQTNLFVTPKETTYIVDSKISINKDLSEKKSEVYNKLIDIIDPVLSNCNEQTQEKTKQNDDDAKNYFRSS